MLTLKVTSNEPHTITENGQQVQGRLIRLSLDTTAGNRSTVRRFPVATFVTLDDPHAAVEVDDQFTTDF